MLKSNDPSLQRWEHRFLVVLAVFSAGLRVLFLIQVHDNPFFNNPTSDAYYYDAQAQSVAAGQVFGNDVFFRAPGYPYWLGLIYALFGHSYVAVRVIQHCLGVASVFLVYLLARRLFSPTVGVVAAILATLYPVLVYFEGQLLFDWFLTFLCLLWLILLFDARNRSTLWRRFIVGFLFGVICVTRPTFLPLTIPLFGYEVWRCYRISNRQSALQVGSLMIAGLMLAILPITVRNYIVGNDVVLIASQGGINFYIGNNPASDGYTSRIPTDVGASWEVSEMSFYVEKELGHRAKPSEESSYWYSKGWDFVVNQPVMFLKLLVKKCYLFWNAIEIPNNLDFYTFARYSWLLRVMPIGFWCVGPLGMLGMILAWKTRHAQTLIMFVLMYCAIMILFFVCDRYRLPVVPLLCIFAAYSLSELFSVIKRKDYKRLIRFAMILLVIAVFVNSNVYQLEKEEPVHQFYMLGLIDQQHGNYASAVSHFEEAASYGKPIRNLFLHWGGGELMLGNVASAREKFRLELLFHPNSYGALANLSALFLDERRFDSAIVYGVRAIEVKPYIPLAYVSVGQAYYRLQDLAHAESVLAVGSTKCGSAFRYGNYLLAGIHLKSGDVQRAESGYRSILHPARHNAEQPYEAEFLVSEERKIGMDDQTLRAKALYGLGHVFATRRGLDSAVAYFQEATQLSPTFADAWADLGVGLLQLRRFVEADSAMHQALRLEPDNFMYWYNYGSLLGSSNRLAQAKTAFEKTLTIQPDFLPAQRDLAFINDALGKLSR